MALAERMLAARFNREGHEIVDHYTYAIASDGDLQEGVSSEASSLAGHLGLGKLIAFYDDNHISIEGDTALSFTEDVGEALRGLRLARPEPRRGHRARPHRGGARATRARSTDRPSLIVVRTHIAPGSPNKQDTHGAHGSPLGEEEIRLTKEAYGWPSQEPFFVPEEALDHFRESSAAARSRRASGSEASSATRPTFPDEAARVRARARPRAAGRAGTPTCRRRARRRARRHAQGLAAT